jgi:hypothetical protein
MPPPEADQPAHQIRTPGRRIRHPAALEDHHRDLGPPPQHPIANEAPAVFPAEAIIVARSNLPATFVSGDHRHRGAGQRSSGGEAPEWGRWRREGFAPGVALGATWEERAGRVAIIG